MWIFWQSEGERGGRRPGPRRASPRLLPVLLEPPGRYTHVLQHYTRRGVAQRQSLRDPIAGCHGCGERSAKRVAASRLVHDPYRHRRTLVPLARLRVVHHRALLAAAQAHVPRARVRHAFNQLFVRRVGAVVKE